MHVTSYDRRLSTEKWQGCASGGELRQVGGSGGGAWSCCDHAIAACHSSSSFATIDSARRRPGLQPRLTAHNPSAAGAWRRRLAAAWSALCEPCGDLFAASGRRRPHSAAAAAAASPHALKEPRGAPHHPPLAPGIHPAPSGRHAVCVAAALCHGGHQRGGSILC